MHKDNSLKAIIKCSLIRELFNDISKNIKNIEEFFIYCNKNGLKIGFKQSAKEMEIQIVLHKALFNAYEYISNSKYSINKYNLKDFVILGTLFDSPKAHINLAINQHSFIAIYQNPNVQIIFNASNLFINENQINLQQIETSICQLNINLQDQCLKVKVNRIGLLYDVVHSAGLFRAQALKFTYNSLKKSLQITTYPGMSVSWEIRVEQLAIEGFKRIFIFSYKKFKSGLGLLSVASSPLIFYLHENYILIQADQEAKKNVIIKIASMIDIQ